MDFARSRVSASSVTVILRVDKIFKISSRVSDARTSNVSFVRTISTGSMRELFGKTGYNGSVIVSVKKKPPHVGGT